MVDKVGAWLLNLGQGLNAAIGEGEMAHVLTGSRVFPLPWTPGHCRDVLLWEGQWLPVMDLAAWLLERPLEAAGGVSAVVAYQDAAGQQAASFGVLRLAAFPSRIEVSDGQACGLPDELPGWRRLSISCFMHAGRKVPVLDLTLIFSKALSTAGRS